VDELRLRAWLGRNIRAKEKDHKKQSTHARQNNPDTSEVGGRK
jgi:hypothetical protein